MLVDVLKELHVELVDLDAKSGRGGFLLFMRRRMVYRFERYTMLLLIIPRNLCPINSACMAASSAIIPNMQQIAVDAEILTDSCVLCSVFLSGVRQIR